MVRDMLPGSFAFQLANPNDRKHAAKKLTVLFVFSILPLFCVLLFGWWFPEGPAGDFFEYTQGGQIFFYVGSIMGSVSCLIAFEDVLDLRKDGEDHTAQRKRRETEKLWLLGYLVASSVISVGALISIQYSAEINTLGVNLTSYLLYLTSLYFWYVCILYDSMKSHYFENEGSIKKKVVDELEGFDGEA